MSTEAKRAGNVRHQGKLMRIVIQPYQDEGEKIKQAAAAAGQSVQGYILEAIRKRMQEESAGNGD